MKVILVQEQEYGDREMITAVKDFREASDLAGLLGVPNDRVEVTIRLEKHKEVGDD